MAGTDDRGYTLRRLRHDLAGAFNELRLCTEVLCGEDDLGRALDWAGMIERAADRCEALIQRTRCPTAAGVDSCRNVRGKPDW